MSFTIIPQATPRINRSELAVPGIRPELFEKAAKSKADVVFLDLEDSVAPDDKEKARKLVIEAIRDIDWGKKTLSVRINGLDTHYCYRDLVDVLEQGGERLDLIMIPKVGVPADIYAIDMICTQIETAMGRKKKTGFELIIETALGMSNVDALAAASPRNESLHFGVADYSASTKARVTGMGGANPNYVVLTDADASGQRATHWADPWAYPIARMIVAARAYGLRPVDGPFGNVADIDGFSAHANRVAALGGEGKWAIHPTQIDAANRIFSPSETEVGQARRILSAMEEAARQGKGAVTLDGKMLDIASIRQAEALVKKANQLAAA